ncbi:MAG: hypothetical protein OEV07_17065, partial [Gammaproteobacteria bacterium]|nr:hypothetical protein [Gammaproteobacteria bacterium]
EDLELSGLTPLVDFVKLEGKEMVNDEVVASTIKRIDDDDYKLQGAVDGWIPIGTSASITVLGIIFPVDTTPITGTEFEGYANAAEFFTALAAAVDPEVEIEDDIPADGVADKVEFE